MKNLNSLSNVEKLELAFNTEDAMVLDTLARDKSEFIVQAALMNEYITIETVKSLLSSKNDNIKEMATEAYMSFDMVA